jgi:hypothetical protein
MSSFFSHTDKPKIKIIDEIMLVIPTIVRPVFIKSILSSSLYMNLIMEVPIPSPEIFTIVVDADITTIARPTLCASYSLATIIQKMKPVTALLKLLAMR